MPFIKKNTGQGSFASSTPARAIFIGRTQELLFFVQHILKPEEPVHNMLSIWGQGGVGKTTLLRQFKNQAETADFKAYCLTAMADDRQETPASMMEKFAQQLHLSHKFEKALNRYKEALQFLPPSRSPSSLQDKMVTRVPDFAGALVEGVIPVAGPLLGEGVKATTEHLLDLHSPTKEHTAAVKHDGPLDTLTQVFINELNQIAATKVTLPSGRTKRERRLFLFFDTFEQVADEAVPWLLNMVLTMDINRNIVFIIAGRNPIERSTLAGPKPWLPYYDDHTIYALPLQPFTQEETAAYLAERGITAKERIDTIWQLSHGLPLYLGLLVSNTQETLDPTRDVVDNFLHRIPSQEQIKRQLVLDAALFSRPFNMDDLEALPYLSEHDRPVLYEWLIRQPFVRVSSLQGRYTYHDVAQELFERHLYRSSPKTYYASRRALATYYQQQFDYLRTVQEKNRYGPSDERLEVMLALASQCFFLPDQESHLQALFPLLDIWEYENIEQQQTALRMLSKTVQSLANIQADSHAHQLVQVLLCFLETYPTLWDQTHHQEWLAAADPLFTLIKSTTSRELLASFYDQYAWGHLRLRNYQEGLIWFERALALYPHSIRLQGRILNGLGNVYHCFKDYQQALEHFNHALQLTPHHPHPYGGRGRTYGRLKMYQQALSDLDHALQLDWKNANPYDQQGRIYMELQDYRKALMCWERLLEVVSEHPRVGGIQFQRGCAHLWLQDLPRATTCFTRSHELASTQGFFSWAHDYVLWAREWSIMCQTLSGPHTLHHLAAIAKRDHYTAHVCRGVLFFLQKEFQQALTALQHATTLHYDIDWYRDPWSDFWREWDAPFWLAMVYIALDQEEEARAALEQAMAMEMPPILLKPLTWFEQDRPALYEKLVKPLLESYEV